MSLTKQDLLDSINNRITTNDNQEISGNDVNTVMSQLVSASINSQDANPQSIASDMNFEGDVTGLPVAYYSEILRSESLVNQTSDGIDTKKPVVFDAVDKESVNGEVRILSNGTIEPIKTGPYMAKFLTQYGRTSNNGVVEIFTQFEFSVDNGATWLPQSKSVTRRINAAEDVISFEDVTPIFISAGILFRMVWAESSGNGGIAGGELSYSQPSAALSALDIQDSPSATVVIYGLQGYDYDQS